MKTLYHYCSTPTFYALLEARAIWLSSLTSSNDYMEGKLVSQAITRLARSEGLSVEDISMMQDSLALMEIVSDGLGFCLSEDGDLLSQWRGYAADGMGVSIGFHKDFLQRIADTNSAADGPGVQLAKVQYDPSAHDILVRPTYEEMKRLLSSPEWRQRQPASLGAATAVTSAASSDAALRTTMQIMQAPLILLQKVFLLKAPGFLEEKEWRLLTHSVPTLGTAPRYRPAITRLVPFKSYAFLEDESRPIAEVILGPKHQTPALVVKQCLAHMGFGEVAVLESRTSYR